MASPEPPQATNPANCADYASLVERYTWDAQTALAVMRAESGCRADAVGDMAISYQANGRTEGWSCGLMQIRVLQGRPDCETLKDPATNIDYAYKLYMASGGFSPWSAFTNGAYLEYTE